MRHLFLIVLAGSMTLAGADDITLRNGTIYKDARIVSHTEATAQIIYADGGVTVPLDLLPADLQTSVGYDPAKAAPVLAQTGEDKEYALALQKYVMINGNLVPRERVTPFPLTFKSIREADAFGTSGRKMGHGSYVEVYDPHYVPPIAPPPVQAAPIITTNTISAADGTLMNIITTDAPPIAPTPPPPGPHDTGIKAFLIDYTSPPGILTTTRVAREGITKEGVTCYLVVADTFTKEDWEKAGSPQ